VAKPTSLTLATTPYEVRADIFQQANSQLDKYSTVKPMRCLLGPNKDHKFERKIRQIGEITYSPQEESEDMRHLKRLPNWILTEENLMEIMSPELLELNLQNNYWVTNDLMNKIGYFAPNVRALDLSYTNCNDDTLVELAKSAHHLRAVNISNCRQVSAAGLARFLELASVLESLDCCHNPYADDDSLRALALLPGLNSLALSFTNVGARTIDALADKLLHFKQLRLSSCPNVRAEGVLRILDKSFESLEVVDLSFNDREGFNNTLMPKIGSCPHLRLLILTGLPAISDEGINQLINGERKEGKFTKLEGFKALEEVRVGGLPNLSDNLSHLFKVAPNIRSLEVNGLERLTDNFLEHAKGLPRLEIVLLNFTGGISDQKVEEVRASHPRTRWVRNLVKPTDPKDDGLRMPYPPAGLKKKKPKAKKK
jgi:F-box/leucine-rich repeat protein 2/20